MAQLLSEHELPPGFQYPPEFIRVVNLGLINLEPWWIIQGDVLTDRDEGLRRRYPERTLVPFAVRQDNDDVACWDAATGSVVVIHDFASSEYAEREKLADFNAWLRRAVEDLIDFE